VSSERDFYDRLAAFFDVMTDWPARLAFELPFLLRLLGQSGGQRILDAACGTGWHAIALAREGYTATGADISAAMIARARANAQSQGVAATFKQASFQQLPEVAGTDFDALLCLGNSLVHVLNDDDLRRSLAAMAGCLRAGRLLVIHNLNYDRRMVERPRWFQVNAGEMEGRETLVWRFADYGEELITFNIAIFQKAADGRWTVQVQSTPQRPWPAQVLVHFVSQAGFGDVQLFGNLAGEPFVPDRSGDLVLVARRLRS